jgi:xylose isomerase
MNPIPQDKQQALVDRLTQACGGSYSPEVRRRYFITGPQWAAAYQGHALFHAPTRSPVTLEKVIEEYSKIGIAYWCTHDTDVIPTEDLFTPKQDEIVGRIKSALQKNGLKCSMVTTETFYHAVWAASSAAEAPDVRQYAAKRVANTVAIGHELGAQYAVYWPGSLGYYVQGAIEETQTLRWFADGINAACEADIEIAKKYNRPTL